MVTTLDAVHDGIVRAIRAQFPQLQSVEFYPLDRRRVVAPACELELTGFEIDAEVTDPGTEQLVVTAHFAARLIMGFRQGRANPKLEVRKLAAAMAVWLRLNRFGQSIGPAQVGAASPDNTEADLGQFECWRVEWSNVLLLGDTFWSDGGAVPVPVYAHTPAIGADNETRYASFPELEERGA